MSNSSSHARALGVLIVAASALPLAQPFAAASPVASAPARIEIQAADTRALIARVADWQLSHLERFDYVAPVGRTPERRGWVQGVFWLGLSAAADHTGDQAYVRSIDALGQAEGWKLGDRLYIADDHLIGQVYLWSYARARDPAKIAPLRTAFDQILAAPPRVDLTYGPRTPAGPLACLSRWCWADALFMAPATWAGLSRATGDPRYLAYAKSELIATIDLLYDPSEHLFFRDSRFITQRAPDGAKIFWSRGNGWVLAGLANFLQALPVDDPDRPRFERVFAETAARVAGLQRPDGSWPSSLIDDHDTGYESSGAGLFVYAMAWGVRAGVLDRARFAAPINRGWARLAQAVAPDGRVGFVQQIGDAPQAPRADETQLYGAGAVLLAGSAVLDLQTSAAKASAGRPKAR